MTYIKANLYSEINVGNNKLPIKLFINLSLINFFDKMN